MTLVVAAIGAGLLGVSSLAVAAEPVDPAGACIGLTCPEPSTGAATIPLSGLVAASLAGPAQLERQTTAGYYEFGRGTTLGTQAVAYVIPRGQVDSIPPEIRALRVVRDISAADYRSGTVVVFGAGVALYVPQHETATAAKASAARRPRARAAADAYGCDDSYFCIYQDVQFQGRRLQWHDISSTWTNLGDYGFNDQASSSRNRRDRDSRLAEHTGGGGDIHCYDSHSSDADFGGWGDDASSLWNNSGDTAC